MKDWWGKKYFGNYHKYNFLSEGDSPTFLCLLPWGLRTLENFSNGSIAGRYVQEQYLNNRGQIVNYWNVTTEAFSDKYGNIVETESMWPYVENIQNDFAWCLNNSEFEKAPEIIIDQELDIEVRSNQIIEINVKAQNNVSYSFNIYQAASIYKNKVPININYNQVQIKIPNDVKTKDTIHLIISATNQFAHHLTRYKQIIMQVL